MSITCQVKGVNNKESGCNCNLAPKINTFITDLRNESTHQKSRFPIKRDQKPSRTEQFIHSTSREISTLGQTAFFFLPQLLLATCSISNCTTHAHRNTHFAGQKDRKSGGRSFVCSLVLYSRWCSPTRANCCV